MNHSLKAALSYMERGWPVFPLHSVSKGLCTCRRLDCSSPGKHPLVRRGLHEATLDPDVAKNWWTRWPKANVGVATGASSDIVVIDIDLPRALKSLDNLVGKLPRTLTGLTGGGGVHFVYRAPTGRSLGNHAGSLPGMGQVPGIDLRADGGYIVVPPSIHRSGCEYEWLDPNTEIANAPVWLKEQPARTVRIPEASCIEGDGTPYGRAALRGLIDEMRSAREGERNHTLYRTAARVSDLITAGHLAQPALRHIELAAASTGLGATEIGRTVASALGRRSYAWMIDVSSC